MNPPHTPTSRSAAAEVGSAPSAATSLHSRAEDNLRFIRASMESATEFTGVSGLGYMLAGVSALGAAWLASQQASNSGWLVVWMLELLFAATLLLTLTALKARKQGTSLLSSNGKKLLLAFFPAMAVGGVLTLNFFLRDQVATLPGIWLSLYGAAVMTAGAYSVAAIPVMGGIFLLLGSLVLLTDLSGDLFLGVGFGLLHIGFGFFIWRHYGG